MEQAVDQYTRVYDTMCPKICRKSERLTCPELSHQLAMVRGVVVGCWLVLVGVGWCWLVLGVFWLVFWCVGFVLVGVGLVFPDKCLSFVMAICGLLDRPCMSMLVGTVGAVGAVGDVQNEPCHHHVE